MENYLSNRLQILKSTLQIMHAVVAKTQNPAPDNPETTKTPYFLPNIPAFTTLEYEKDGDNSFWVHLIAQCVV